MDVSVYGVVGGLHHVQLEGTLSNVFAVQSNMQFQWPGDHGRILHKVPQCTTETTDDGNPVGSDLLVTSRVHLCGKACLRLECDLHILTALSGRSN